MKYILLKIDEKFSEFKSEIAAIVAGKDERIGRLESEVGELKGKIDMLQERIEETESRDRQRDVIISGNCVCTAESENDDIEGLVHRLLRGKVNYEIPTRRLVSASRLGKKPFHQGPDKRPIIIRFDDQRIKTDVIRAFRAVKPTDLYANENLTQVRSRILFTLRQVKRNYPQILNGCGSQNGRVYAWIKQSDTSEKNIKIFINSLSKLESVCTEYLGVRPDEIVGAPQQK